MGEGNWRTEVTAEDYFGAQKKRLQVESRRGVARGAADLVGPGIGRYAARVADFDDPIVAVNGFVMSVSGAVNAPPRTGGGDGVFVGTIVTDSGHFGYQQVTEASTGKEWRRMFYRNLTDPAALLTFTPWTRTNLIINAGRVTIPTPALNTLYSAVVTFAVPFLATPSVSTTPASSPAGVFTSATAFTTTTATINVYRTTGTGSTTISWQAFEV